MRQFHPIVFAVFLISAAGAQTVHIDESASRVKLQGKTYEVSLSAKSTAAISGTATLEIITPDDSVLASSEVPLRVAAGNGQVSGTATLSQLPKQQDDLLWYRLRYTISATHEEPIRGILPLFQTVETFNLIASAPYQVGPGQKFFVRVRTTHPVLERAVGGVAVKAMLEDDDSGAPLSSAFGTTDRNGYVQIAMTVPQKEAPHKVNIKVEARRGATVRTTEIEVGVGEATNVLLQTDKPLYQPGQILHIRSVIFGKQNRALAGKKISLQVEDQDNTVVFREERTSSKFGVAAADWSIPERIKLGSYHVTAKTYPGTYPSDEDDDSDSSILTSSSDHKTVRISRYDLPTFVVAANPDKGYYLPGQKPRVIINAAYLFGKPVSNAKVRVAQLEERQWDFLKQQWEIDEGEAVEGVTNEHGDCTIELDLKDAQQRLAESERAKFRDVTFTAYVTDTGTGRTEERRFDLRATRDAIHVYFLAPGYARRGLPDEFYISTSYADGSAAQTEVEVRTSAPDGSGERLLTKVRTNRYGVARVRGARAAIPMDEQQVPLILIAQDRKGARGVTSDVLPAAPDQVLWLETTKTIFAPGESIDAELHSNFDGEILFEVSNRDKVLQSFTMRLRHQHAFVKIPYNDNFKGMVTLAAGNLAAHYAEFVQAGRTVFFPENRKLNVAVKLDRGEYRPGQPGVATVRLKTAEGVQMPGVIGAVIFDKAVEERARIDEDLRENFGFGFYGYWWYRGTAKLSQLSLADLDSVDTNKPVPEDLEIAADFLLNASGYPSGSWLGKLSDDSANESAHEIYKKQIDMTLQPLLASIDRFMKTTGTLPTNMKQLDELLARDKLRWSEFRDPWNHEFIPQLSVNEYGIALNISSRGPDQTGAPDADFTVARRNASFYEPTNREVTRAVMQYRAKKGFFVRDAETLKLALADARVDPALLLDPWGHAYEFDFGIDRSQYTVTGKTRGKEDKPRQSYAVGTSGIDYFAESRAAIQKELNGKVQGLGKIPETAEQFKAMLLPEFDFDSLRDPYGRPYLLRVHELARYADNRVQTNDGVNFTPVTLWTRTFKVRSAGADGIPDTADDFDVSAFSAMLAETTVEGRTYPARVNPLFSGETGGIDGVVTDVQGAVIAGAPVKATNVATGVEYQTRTDPAGAFVIGNLPPGLYRVEVSATGFVTSSFRDVLVIAQQMISIKTTLNVGGVEETVEVSASTAGGGNDLCCFCFRQEQGGNRDSGSAGHGHTPAAAVLPGNAAVATLD